MEVRPALRRSRQVLATVLNPSMRSVLTGGAGADERTSTALARFDWLTPGAGPDPLLLRETMTVLESLLTDQAILRFDRVRDLPADEQRRRDLSVVVVRLVFERVAVRGGISEEVLSAALAMLVEDVATVRRDAVDAGVLERTADGRTYTLQR